MRAITQLFAPEPGCESDGRIGSPVTHVPSPQAFADGAAAPGAELRAAPRFTLLIRTAKLVAAGGEYLCVLRDASATGIKVKIFHPLPGEPRMELELPDGERFAVEKVWEEAGSAGFRFAAPIDIARFLGEAPTGLRKRPVRLRLAVPARLCIGDAVRPVHFRDISQQGACIECDERLAMDQRVRLECAFLPAIEAKVRWRRQPLYGVIFERTFRFDELAQLTAPLQRAGEAEPAGRRRA